jgi:hypothetical protein
MSFTSWIRSLMSRLVPTGRAKARSRRGRGPAHYRRPQLEALEDRCLLSVTPPSGIIGWWPGDGGPNDISGGGYATVLNDTGYAAGKVGQAFSFDGSDDGVAVSGTTNVQGARTIEAWVFPHANTGRGLPIMTGGTVGVHGDFFAIDSTNKLYVDHWNVGGPSSSSSLTPDAWNHVAMTFDGSTIRYYINGQAAGSGSGSLYDYPLNTYDIGGNAIGGTTTKASMNGLIDEPTLYNRALSASEILSIYNAGASGKTKPFVVIGSTPNAGQTVATPPTDFVIKLTKAYDATSVQAAALQVNGVAADSVSLTDAQTLTFHYATSPVTAQGGQTMQLAAGALRAAGSGASLTAFTGLFLYNTSTPSSGWVITNGGSGISAFTALTKPDSAGNLYVAGSFAGTITLGTTTLTSPNGGYDSANFVARIDGSGNVLWAEQIGDYSGSNLSLALDGSGNLYLGAGFWSYDTYWEYGYLAKLDSSGNVQWVVQTNNALGNAAIHDVAVDAAGNAYVAGYYSGTAQFGSLSLTAPGGQDDAFLAQVDATGHFVWAEDVAANAGTDAFPLAGDGAGNIYAGGRGTAPGTSGPGYLLKVNSNGAILWADGMSAAPAGLAVSQDPVTAAVALYGASSPGTVFRVSPSSGSVLWSQSVNGLAGDASVATDAAGNVYLSGGDTTTPTDADPGPGTAYLSSSTASNTGYGYYVTKLDSSGNFLATRQVGPVGATALQVDGAGNIYTAGAFPGTGIFDTGSGYVTEPEPPGNPGPLFVCKTTQATGNVFGQVFNDLNGNGTFDPAAGETNIQGRTVYLDLNNNGVLDPGEPSTVTGSQGQFEFDHLLPGNYTVRQLLPSGWTQTAPSGNAGLAVNVAAGASVDSLLFGDHPATITRTYANTSAVKTSKGKPNAVSTLTVSDANTIFDLSVTLTVSNTHSAPLTVTLKGPDGTTVTLVASTNINGTLTYHTSGFNYKSVKGTWTLEVDGLAGGILNSWSMSVLESAT